MEEIDILFVDDDTNHLGIVKDYFDANVSNIRLYTCSSVDDALLELEKKEFDAILCDNKMPNKSGLYLLYSLREKGNNIFFILYTAFREFSAVKTALNYGADFYITKDGDFAELALKLKNLVLNQKKVRDQSKSSFNSNLVIKIGILTAFELESDAIIEAFDLREKPQGFLSFWENVLPRKNPEDGSFKIIHLLGDKGKDIGKYVSEIINQNLDYLFLVGIAGGLVSNGVMIGDILVCSDIADYDKSSEGNRSKRKTNYININDKWLHHLRNFKIKKQLGSKSKIHLDESQIAILEKAGISSELPRKKHIGKYFCGSKVVKTKEKVDKILRSSVSVDDWENFIGVEMEAYSIIDIGEWIDPSLPVAIIKGVSDLPELHNAEEDIWDKFHELAAYSAAYFLKVFLERGGLSPRSFNMNRKQLEVYISEPLTSTKEEYGKEKPTEVIPSRLKSVKMELKTMYEEILLLSFASGIIPLKEALGLGSVKSEKTIKMTNFIKNFLLYSKEFDILQSPYYTSANTTVDFLLKNNPENKIWQTINAKQSILKISDQDEGIGSKLILDFKKIMISKTIKLGFYISNSNYTLGAHEEILKAKDMGYLIIIVTQEDFNKFFTSDETFSDFFKNKLLRMDVFSD